MYLKNGSILETEIVAQIRAVKRPYFERSLFRDRPQTTFACYVQRQISAWPALSPLYHLSGTILALLRSGVMDFSSIARYPVAGERQSPTACHSGGSSGWPTCFLRTLLGFSSHELGSSSHFQFASLSLDSVQQGLFLGVMCWRFKIIFASLSE
jgi:hypothetical protein